MTRAFDQNRDNLFDGWTLEQVTEYARQRVAQYDKPSPEWTAGERELLRDAWNHVASRWRPDAS